MRVTRRQGQDAQRTDGGSLRQSDDANASRQTTYGTTRTNKRENIRNYGAGAPSQSAPTTPRAVSCSCSMSGCSATYCWKMEDRMKRGSTSSNILQTVQITG